MWIWISCAILVIALLAGYAIYLNVKLQKRDRQRVLWRQEVEEMVQERTDNITNSVLVIASAMLEDQMSMSECCMRLSALLNQLGPIGEDARFQSVHKAAEELDHIPILDEWKQLKFREQMKYMKEMEVVEAKYGDFVLEVCRSLQSDGLKKMDPQGVGYFQP